MTPASNDERPRHRRSHILSTAAIIAAAAAIVINILIIDPSNIGVFIAIMVAVGMTCTNGTRGRSCGRRHAK